MPSDERRTAGGRGLRGHHAERLGEDRRHDAGAGERQQVHEVAVLQRAREQRARAGCLRLELGAVVAEADDHGARVDALERLEQDVDALVVEELAEVDDGRLVRREEPGKPFGIPLVRQSLLRVARIRRVAARFLEEAGERRRAAPRPELLDVHAGRDLVHAVDVADHLLEHGADMRRADEHRIRALEALPAPHLELRVAAHRVLELGAVRLDRVARAARCADRPAEQHVVREHDVGRQQLPERSRVRLDVALPLLGGQVLQSGRLEPLVAVDDEHGQQPIGQLRPHDARAAEVESLRMRLLADDDHVVARARPFARERARVDVRARAREQVPVPEQDPHRARP